MPCNKNVCYPTCTVWNNATDKDFSNSKVVPVPVLAAWRLIVGVYFLGWWIYNVICYPAATFFIFLTHWAFTVSTVYFLFGAVLSITASVQTRKNQVSEERTEELHSIMRLETTETDEERGEDIKDVQYGNELTWYHKAFWIMYSITANVTLAIAAFYYGYFYFRENPDNRGVGLVSDLSKHAFATLFLLLETLISGIPVLFSQVIFPLIFTGSYMVFTVIFWLAEGKNHAGKKQIYEGITYGIIPAGYVVLGAFLFASTQLMSQLALWGIYKLRRRFCETSSG